MKTCYKCKKIKNLDEFNRLKKAKDGRQSECRQCASERHKSIYNALTPEEKSARLERHRQRNIAYRRDNPEAVFYSRIKSMYSLSREQYDALFESQGRRCAICSRDTPGGRYGTWNVDHDHVCCPGTKSCGGCVRGILCHWCNHGLGNFGDDTAVLASAIAYLS